MIHNKHHSIKTYSKAPPLSLTAQRQSHILALHVEKLLPYKHNILVHATSICGHLKSPGLQPISLVALGLLWRFASNEKTTKKLKSHFQDFNGASYVRSNIIMFKTHDTWHWMPSLRPGVIKQHKTQPRTLIIPLDVDCFALMHKWSTNKVFNHISWYYPGYESLLFCLFP